MWWHTVTHGRRSEGETGEWSGLPVPFTLPRNLVYPALLSLMRTPRLPVVDWTDAPTDLNGLIRFAERRNLVSARVPSHFKRGYNTATVKGVKAVRHIFARCLFLFERNKACIHKVFVKNKDFLYWYKFTVGRNWTKNMQFCRFWVFWDVLLCGLVVSDVSKDRNVFVLRVEHPKKCSYTWWERHISLNEILWLLLP
jgi:hypothetical protein